MKSGATGLLYRPALRCLGEIHHRDGKISKLMHFDEAEHEYDINQTIKKIDVNQKFFIYAEDICLPNTDIIDGTISEKETIDIINTKYQTPNLLIFNDGGADLWNINVSYSDLLKFFEGFENIFQGVKTLHYHDFLHFDIKPSNIVGKQLVDGSFNIRLIDFGLSRNVDSVNDGNLKTNYAYWPFDTRLHTNSYIYSESDVDDFYTKQFSSGEYYPLCFLYKMDHTRLIRKDKMEELHRDIKDKKLDTKRLIKSIDVFSLGRSLSEIYGKLLKHRFVNFHTIDIETEIDDYQELIKNEVSFPIYYLCEMMTCVNPLLRPTIEECCDIYKNILTYMQQHFTVNT